MLGLLFGMLWVGMLFVYYLCFEIFCSVYMVMWIFFFYYVNLIFILIFKRWLNVMLRCVEYIIFFIVVFVMLFWL